MPEWLIVILSLMIYTLIGLRVSKWWFEVMPKETT